MNYIYFGTNVIHTFTDTPEGIHFDRAAIDKCSICDYTRKGQIKLIPDRFAAMTKNPRLKMCYSIE